MTSRFFLVRLGFGKNNWCAKKATGPVDTVENALVRPDLNDALASRGLHRQVKLSLVFAKVENEVCRQCCFHVQI